MESRIPEGDDAEEPKAEHEAEVVSEEPDAPEGDGAEEPKAEDEAEVVSEEPDAPEGDGAEEPKAEDEAEVVSEEPDAPEGDGAEEPKAEDHTQTLSNLNIETLISVVPNPNVPEFRQGDTVRASHRIVEGDRERVQLFEGVVIRRQGRGPGASFTVRRVTHTIGVERTFPIYSPRLEKVEVLRRGRVRRAKLYYLRGRTGKAARIRERVVRR